MAVTSKLIQVLPSQMAELGDFVRKRREELGLTQQQVAERCNQSLAGDTGRKIDRFRIAKIEMAAQPKPGDGAARAVYPTELRALATALEYPPELILGSENDMGVIWDSLSNPQLAEDFLNLLRRYEADSNHLLSWARFLPCSLETPEFMHAHHVSIFKDVAHPEYKMRLIDLFDGIGMRRRTRMHEHGSRRKWEFHHFMFLEDLEKIATGSHEYSSIGKRLRQDCLKYLRELVCDQSLKIFLFLSNENRFTAGKAFFSGIDSLIIYDTRLAIWRDARGYLYWSTSRHIVAQHSELLKSFRKNCRYKDPVEVGRCLEHLSRLRSRAKNVR